MTVSHHVRSNSYPLKQHPQVAHVDEQLNRLRSSETASSSSSSSSICQRLGNLQELHDSLEKMICLSFTTLSQDQIEKLLDGSIKILDLCNIAKDGLSQMKESLKEIQSIVRRKRGDSLSTEIKKYIAARKFLKKSFLKILKSLKIRQNKDHNDKSLVVFGEEAETLTIALFESLFSFMSGSKNCGKWSLVSKRKVTSEINEFTRVDLEFQSEKSVKMEDVEMLESCIEDFEDGIESLSKSLIKYRVSILSI